ncbi:MAG: SpoIIE family protein phosphatase [Bacteroidia bacterium]
MLSPGETLAIQPPETLPLPDTLLVALRQSPKVGSSAPIQWIPLKAESLSTDISEIVRALKLFSVRPSGQKAYSFDALRPYVSFAGRLRRRRIPLTAQRMRGEVQRIHLDKPALPDDAFFPAVFYGQESGVPLDAPVVAVEEDKYGRIWIFTQGSLMCWSGSVIEVFGIKGGLPTSSILHGTCDLMGRIWFGGSRGVAWWDGTYFYKVPLSDSIQRVMGVVHSDDGIAYLRVRGHSIKDTRLMGWRQDTLYEWIPEQEVGLFPIRYDSAGLWCSVYEGDSGFSLGIVRRDTLWRIKGWNNKASVQRLLWDSWGRLWIANARGLWHWQMGNATQVGVGGVTALNEAASGYLICLKEGKLYYTSGDSLRELDIGLPSNTAYDFVYRRSDGEWLLFTREGGVAVLRPSGIFRIPIIRLLGHVDWVFAVYPTVQGGLWVGLEQSGLLYISPTLQVVKYTVPADMGYSPITEVASIRPLDTMAWLSWYSQGLRQATYLQPLSAKIAYPPPRGESWLDVCPSPQGWLWQSHPEALGISSPIENKVRYRLPLRPTSPFFRDSQGWIWFGVQESLYVWTGEALLRYMLPDNTSPIFSISQDRQGRLLVGTVNSGLYCLEKMHWRRWKRPHGLTDNLVAQIVPTENCVWIGSGEGIACLNLDENRIFAWRAGTGLIGATGINGGLFRSAWAFVDRAPVMGFLRSGSWLTGAGASILCFLPEANMSSSPPHPYIVAVEVKGVSHAELDSLGWADSLVQRPYVLPIGLRLPYEKNSIAFTFSHDGSLTKQAGVEYRIFLEGYDESWGAPSSDGRIEYRQLPPGYYKLYVCARYADSDWSSPIVYSFTIERPWWLTPGAFLLYVGLLGVGIWGIVRWRTAVLRARARELAQKVEEATATIRQQNILLHQQNTQLAEQNKLISDQKKEIEAKNQALLESITYARRIQTAILPPEDVFGRYFPEGFIFWRPRDIVSGDVYSLYPDPLGSQDLYLFVADCTGHGVPGAFMSLLSLTLLNRTITEYRLTDPAEILKTVSWQLVSLLHPDAPGHVKDGFEGVLAKLIWREGRFAEIEYASARSPFWLVRQGEVYEQPYDPIPVGPPEVSRQAQMGFTLRRLIVEAGDWIYFSSDGFMDQLGSPKGRKYGYKAFRQLLTHLSTLSAIEQKERLERELEQWRGAHPQVDDILIIGVQMG